MSNWARAIYRASPITAQQALVSLEGLQFRYRRSDGGVLRAVYRELMESQNWPAERFAGYQAAELARVLRHAFASVPYYHRLRKALGCDPEDFRTVEDLRRLPVLEKSAVRGNEDDFRSAAHTGWKCTRGHTSGTTGTPIELTETRASFSRRWAFVARLRTWAEVGEPFYPRRAQFTGRDIVPGNPSGPFWRRNLAGNALLFSTTHISRESAPAYVAALNRFGPELVDGYPSALRLLARLAGERGLRLRPPRAAIVSAETLSPEARQELEAAFGCKVYNQYAASEPSCFWCDCDCGVMHENPEYGISEILGQDGSPAAPGEAGEVVVTSFLNPAMVLLRYRLGDLAIRGADRACDCGRRMPRIESVVGRTDDLLVAPGRGYLGRMDPVFKGVGNIVEAQIVQESLARIRVSVVPAEGYSSSDESALRANLIEKLGQGIELAIVRVASIPRGPNGKFRAVVSHVSRPLAPAVGGEGVAGR